MTETRKPGSCVTGSGVSKRQYDKRTAKQVAKRQGKGVSVYRCTVCPFWHVGHYSEGPRTAP